MKIQQTLSNNPLRRALRKMADLRKQEVGDVVADVVNSKSVRVTVQKRINQVLHVQRMVSEGVGKALGAVNISSRDDVQKMASQLASVEDVMAQLQVEVRQLRVALAAGRGASTAPSEAAPSENAPRAAIKRTRQPPPVKS